MKLRREIDQLVREDGERPADYFTGPDWCELLPEEELVFGIRMARWPRMMNTWSAYEVFMGTSHLTDFSDDAIGEARQAQPEIKSMPMGEAGFFLFAEQFGGLTLREADAVYAKHHFWLVRAGAMRYADGS